jgi:hypothetical protein
MTHGRDGYADGRGAHSLPISTTEARCKTLLSEILDQQVRIQGQEGGGSGEEIDRGYKKCSPPDAELPTAGANQNPKEVA